MSSRFWPAKQSILPIIPTTPVTARLNLDCHLLNHPIRARLFQDQIEQDRLIKKPVVEQVLSRRKDHTLPTRWSLYRPLIRNARKVDYLLANSASAERGETSTQALSPTANTALTKYVRKHWKTNLGMQGYTRVRDWLSVQYEASHSLQIKHFCHLWLSMIALGRIWQSSGGRCTSVTNAWRTAERMHNSRHQTKSKETGAHSK
jgi:hypothetical protein